MVGHRRSDRPLAGAIKLGVLDSRAGATLGFFQIERQTAGALAIAAVTST